MKKLILTCKNGADGLSFEEEFDAGSLVAPEDVGRRMHLHDRISVENQTEAARYAVDLLRAFNGTRHPLDPPRVLLDVRLEGDTQ
jgi:hypothetical protein